jgi:NodT family efflux transporter outer membrane factor (OMF) lipoprotein
VVLGLSACANLPDSTPQATLRDAASVGLPTQATPQQTVGATWWTAWGDAQLNTLIEEALASNPSLKIAQARIARAQAGFEVTRAARSPQLGVGFEATQQLFTANGMVPKTLGGSIYATGTAQFTGSYELDFFGKNRAALDAALGLARAAQADSEAARMVLASQVARTYFQEARLQAQIALTERVLAQRTQALRLMQDRVNAGLDTQLELRPFESSLPESRLQLEILQEQRELTHHALEALTSKPNRPISTVNHAIAATLNIADAKVLPFDLLGRRADIAAARWRVEAATQDMGSARAQFYPSVNLVAFAGFSSIGLDKLLDAGSSQWGVGPALRLPMFDGGRLRANLRGKAADLDAAIESYNATVLDAVRDVADQLSSQQSIRRQIVEQASVQALAQTHYDLALQRFGAGVVNALAVLNSEQALLIQRRQAIDLNARALDTQVALMRALGGGYQADLPTATAHPSTPSH